MTCQTHPGSPRISYAAGDDCRRCLVEESIAAQAAATAPETCEHGLSAWLCAGPGHCPADPGAFPW